MYQLSGGLKGLCITLIVLTGIGLLLSAMVFVSVRGGRIDMPSMVTALIGVVSNIAIMAGSIMILVGRRKTGRLVASAGAVVRLLGVGTFIWAFKAADAGMSFPFGSFVFMVAVPFLVLSLLNTSSFRDELAYNV